MPPRLVTRRALCASSLLLGGSGLAWARQGGVSRPSPSFVVKVGAIAEDHLPLTGRLIVVIGPENGQEPRLAIGRTGPDAPTILGVDVDALRPGSSVRLDSGSTIFPHADLAGMRSGTYAVQAVLHVNRDLNFPGAPGDFTSDVRRVALGAGIGPEIRLDLTAHLPDERMPRDEELVRSIRVPSPALSRFHGRPIELRAGLILPRDYHRDREWGRTYPLRVHIGGYGARFTRVGRLMSPNSEFHRAWMADEAPRMILLHLDGAGPLGDPYQVNSANHGPYGDAVVHELIPAVERLYWGRGSGQSRVVDGASTGGWVALALQVFYPDEFHGAWAFSPDSVDFRNFQLLNIYEDENAYVDSRGRERPAARDASGRVRHTMRHECQLENALGRGNSWTLSGAQWGAWNATYGPRGSDGRPVPLWNPVTGSMNHSVAEHWRAFDLRRVIEQGWSRLAPRLAGKLHIRVGESDDYFLNLAVHRLDESLRRVTPRFDGTIAFGPGGDHSWRPIPEAELLRQMASRVDGSLIRS